MSTLNSVSPGYSTFINSATAGAAGWSPSINSPSPPSGPGSAQPAAVPPSLIEKYFRADRITYGGSSIRLVASSFTRAQAQQYTSQNTRWRDMAAERDDHLSRAYAREHPVDARRQQQLDARLISPEPKVKAAVLAPSNDIPPAQILAWKNVSLIKGEPLALPVRNVPESTPQPAPNTGLLFGTAPVSDIPRIVNAVSVTPTATPRAGSQFLGTARPVSTSVRKRYSAKTPASSAPQYAAASAAPGPFTSPSSYFSLGGPI